jgi:hypothetical protein
MKMLRDFMDCVEYLAIEWRESLIPFVTCLLLLGIMAWAIIASGAELGASIPESYVLLESMGAACSMDSSTPDLYKRQYGIDGDMLLLIFGVMNHPPAVYIHYAPGESGGVTSVYLKLPNKPMQHFDSIVQLQTVMPTPCALLKHFTPRQGAV